MLFPVYEWYHEPSEVLGVPLLRFRRGKLREIEVPWVHRSREAVTAPRPRGYLVLPGWPDIESRLAGHALRVEELRRTVELDVQVLRLSDPETSSRANPSYQGLTGIRVNVERRTERRRFPPGTLWVPAAQPDFEVAVQLGALEHRPGTEGVHRGPGARGAGPGNVAGSRARRGLEGSAPGRGVCRQPVRPRNLVVPAHGALGRDRGSAPGHALDETGTAGDRAVERVR